MQNRRGQGVADAFKKTKTGERRTVPVSSRLKEVLIRRMEGLKSDDLVFIEDGYQYVKLCPQSVMRLVENLERDKNDTKSFQSLNP